jgi:hypothetical protein
MTNTSTVVFITRWVMSRGIQMRTVQAIENGQANDTERPDIIYQAHEWHVHEADALERAIKVIEAEEKGKRSQLKELETFKERLLQARRGEQIGQPLNSTSIERQAHV